MQSQIAQSLFIYALQSLENKTISITYNTNAPNMEKLERIYGKSPKQNFTYCWVSVCKTLKDFHGTKHVSIGEVR